MTDLYHRIAALPVVPRWAASVETMEDYPGDIEMIECIVALQSRLSLAVECIVMYLDSRSAFDDEQADIAARALVKKLGEV